ncbi:MAG: competence/damage-inducible protein A, partial [Lutimonas sp.]
MIAEIITIGDEILIGQITDTNSKWIAERLNEIGISVYQITSIQDDREHIIKTLREAERNVDIIMITGGLGPTKDDITKNTLAEYFDDELTYRPEVAEHIKQLFSKISIRVTHLDDHQAMLPSKSLVLKNRYGTASGMWFNENGKIVVSLPGVPFEMKGLMSESVIPK